MDRSNRMFSKYLHTAQPFSDTGLHEHSVTKPAAHDCQVMERSEIQSALPTTFLFAVKYSVSSFPLLDCVGSIL